MFVVSQVRASGSNIELPTASTQEKGKALVITMKAAIQIALRIFKLENSSNAELSNRIGSVSQDLNTLKTKVDGHENAIADADKKAQEALDEVAKIKTHSSGCQT